MIYKLKRAASIILVFAALLTCLPTASAALLGLTRGTRTTTTLAGSTRTTPKGYLFGFGGKKFILLDSEVKDGKNISLFFARTSMESTILTPRKIWLYGIPNRKRILHIG